MLLSIPLQLAAAVATTLARRVERPPEVVFVSDWTADPTLAEAAGPDGAWLSSIDYVDLEDCR